MKKKYLNRNLLGLILICLFSITKLNAQTWESPIPDGSIVNSGSSYYVYNVGTNTFLDRGGQWKTQATTAAYTGSLITLTASDTKWILQYESSSKTLFPAGTNGDVYTDNSTNNTWQLALTDATKNLYTIQINTAYSGYNAEQYLGASKELVTTNTGLVHDVRYNRAATNGAHNQWIFCTAEALAKYQAKVNLDRYMQIAKLTSNLDLTSYIDTYNTGSTTAIAEAASTLNAALNPQDKTSLLVNPFFDSNPSIGWTTSNSNYGYNNNEVEYWQKTFNFHQDLTGLPAGIYVLKVQGFERPASSTTTTAVTAYTNGWDAISSRFYVTTSDSTLYHPIRSIFSETTASDGSEINGIKYPNSMGQANTAFLNGLYDNEIGYIKVDGTGIMTLGVSNTFTSSGSGDWVLFDNFRLYYYGAYKTPSLAASPSSLLLSESKPTATIAVGGTNLSSAISLSSNNPNLSFEPSTISAANANENNNILVTLNTTTASTSLNDTIFITADGVETYKIPVVTSIDSRCFVASQGGTNLVPDPFMLDVTKYSTSWGAFARVISDEACGATYAKVSGQRAGSLTFPIEWTSNHKYHLYAKVNTNADGFVFGMGNSYAGEGVNADYEYSISNTNANWVDVDVEFIAGANAGTGNVWFNNYASNLSGIGCIDNWELYDLGVTSGIKDVSDAGILIQSQPNGVKITSSDKVNIKIYTTLGKLVSNFDLQGTTSVSLAKGLYLINGIKTIVK